MKFSSLLLSIFCTFILFNTSCTKEVVDNVTPPVSENQSQLLAQLFEIDSTLPVKKDTVYRGSFTYDRLNRLIERKDLTTDRNGDSNYLSTTIYEYLNNDTLAFRTITKSIGFGAVKNESFDTAYYKFSDGSYISDSINYSRGAYSINSFTYRPGIIERNFKNFVPYLSYSANEYQKIYQTKVNGNITYQIDTLISSSVGNPILTYTRLQTDVSYLPNPNPLYKISTPIYKQYYSYEFANFSKYYAPKQLVAKQVINFEDWSSSGFSDNRYAKSIINYDYTFRTDGFPLEARVTSDLGNGIKKTKFLFVYK